MKAKRATNATVSERLERLMDDAAELFAQEGFLHFSTDDLARRLHCSKRTLYAVAPGRERFFEAVILRRNNRQQSAVIAAVEQARDIEAAVLMCVETIVDNLESLSPVYLRDHMHFPPGVRLAKRFQKQITDALVRVIERGERENVFRKIEARVAAEALFASVMRMIEPDFLASSRVTAAEAVRQVYQIFWFGLRRNHDAGAGKVHMPQHLPRVGEFAVAVKA